MRKMLVVDAGHGPGRWGQAITAPRGTLLCKSTKVTGGIYDELLIVDYGDEASRLLVLDGLAYRAEHRSCKLAVMRVLREGWSDLEAMARIYAEPTTDPERFTMPLSALTAIASPDTQIDVKLGDECILFEYAA